jgi:hypothetical protein
MNFRLFYNFSSNFFTYVLSFFPSLFFTHQLDASLSEANHRIRDLQLQHQTRIRELEDKLKATEKLCNKYLETARQSSSTKSRLSSAFQLSDLQAAALSHSASSSSPSPISSPAPSPTKPSSKIVMPGSKIRMPGSDDVEISSPDFDNEGVFPLSPLPELSSPMPNRPPSKHQHTKSRTFYSVISSMKDGMARFF